MRWITQISMNKPNKEEYYSIADIAKNQFLFYKDHKTILELVKRDAKDKNILKAIKRTSPVKTKKAKFGVRYLIKGANIIKAVARLEKNTLFKKK